MDFSTSFSAADFAKKAAEYAANLTPEQNQIRQDNARRSNVSREYSETDAQQMETEQADHQPATA